LIPFSQDVADDGISFETGTIEEIGDGGLMLTG